jgi:hypothetical protein
MRTRANRLVTLLLAATITVGTAACGSDSDTDAASPPTEPVASRDATPAASIDVTAREYAFELASGAEVRAGYVPVTLRNAGAQPHQVMIARLHDGVTIDEFVAKSHQSEAAANELVDYAGGVNAIGPGATAKGFADLAPGNYALICFVPTDGVGHLHKGMITGIEVVGSGAPVAAPASVGEIHLQDYGIALPAAGVGTHGTYKVVNDGKEPHEMVLLKLKDGKGLGDAAAYSAGGMKGEAPFTYAGGAGGVAPGRIGYVDLALEPGNYIALCVFQSPHTHKAHLDMGMVTTFTVS